MVAGSRTDGGSQVTSFRVRKVIQSIKEIVGNHSDADIYAVLKESNMDPNETAQKLLNQDPFHEVKRKGDKKKELTGYRGLSDSRRHVEHIVQPARHVEHNVHPARHVEHIGQPGRHVEHIIQPGRHVEHHVQSAKSHMTWDRNGRRGGYIRNSVPGVSREFRIVRDNRVKQNVNKDDMPESVQHSASGTDQAKTDFPEKCVGGTPVIPQSVIKPSDSVNDGPRNKEDVVQGGILRPSLLKTTSPTATVTSSQAQREVKDNSKAHSTSTSTNSVIGVYSSSSDPVHVPFPASRSAGIVGAIRREVGVVGVRKQSLNHPSSNSSLSNSSFSVPSLGKDASSSSESFAQSVATSKSSQLDQAAASEPTFPPGRSTGSQYNSKVHQQPMGHQKAMQSTMEWKPKSSQKPAIISPSTSVTASAPSSSHADNSSDSNLVDVTNLSEKLSEVNILEERHVIIPRHLRVPESERTQLTFGSFGTGFDSTKVSSSVSQAFESSERSSDGPSVSLSTSIPVGSSGNTSGDDQGDLSDCQASRSDSPASAAESEQTSPENNESLNHQNIENYGDIGLVQGQSPSYTTSHSRHLQTPTSLPNFSQEYDPQKSYDYLPFLRTVMEDNSRAQGFVSSSEAVSSHVTNISPPSIVALAQQQQPLQQQQQQQPVANMYPQVHISHFPSFMPYRHIFSPVYVPPMAMPNYSSNPAYPHPSNANSYLLMSGGSSHVTAGGMKYAASQFKPVPAGGPTAYGNYANPTGFTISPPGSVGGATGLEDATRIKYKDNNLYIPNPQAEMSDVWIQHPRELSSLQSAPYYSLAGQPPHAAAPAFIPAAHAGHTPFNAAAAQSSHVQYPGLYHPPASPAPIAGPHHVVHQSGHGGNISGVGVAAAAPGLQVGAYQQPQLGHLNWPANF